MKIFEQGELSVLTITEREGPQRRPQELFIGFDANRAAAHLEAMPQASYARATDRLFHTYQSFLLRLPGRVIMVDTCVGEGKARPPHFNYPKIDWPMNLKRAGISLADVDTVICTHLHVDHCGWNTTLKDGYWIPTFPNATYFIGEEEYRYWEVEARRGNDLPARIWTDSAVPLVEAGCAQLVPMDHVLDDAIRFVAAPGHTPGMFRVDVEAEGARVVFATDIIHHPLQCREPDWSTTFCVDPKLAAETRRAFLEEVADTDTVVIPEHFSYPVAGRVIRKDGAFRFVYLDGRVL